MSDSDQHVRKYSFLEIVGAIVALSGFLAALAWYLGDSFNKGYYQALGISDDIARTSNYELTSRGALYFVAFLVGSSFIIILEILILNIPLSKPICYLQDHVFKRLSPKRKISLSYYVVMLPLTVLVVAFAPLLVQDIAHSQVPIGYLAIVFALLLLVQLELSRIQALKQLPGIVKKLGNRLYIIILFFPLMFFFILNAFQSINYGYQVGCEDVRMKNNMYTIYSTQQLPLENKTNALTQNGLFEYSGYYGLVGDEYLVLYDQVDAQSSIPSRIYFLRKTGVFSFSVTKSQPSNKETQKISIECQKITEARVKKAFYLATVELWK